MGKKTVRLQVSCAGTSESLRERAGELERFMQRLHGSDRFTVRLLHDGDVTKLFRDDQGLFQIAVDIANSWQWHRPPERPLRHRLPDERDSSFTHTFVIYGRGYDGNPKRYSGDLTMGLYRNGELGEIFVRMDKMGGRQGALLDAWATMVSIALQSGIPLEEVIGKFKNWTFEPRGLTDNKTIKACKSPLDYIVRYLELRFLGRQDDQGMWVERGTDE